MEQTLEQVLAASPARLLPGRYAIARVADGFAPPSAFAAMRDEIETTAIVEERDLPAIDALAAEKWFRAIALHVATPFEAPGFIAAATSALAAAGINVYVVSTFSLDYVFVREEDAERSLLALAARGFPMA